MDMKKVNPVRYRNSTQRSSFQRSNILEIHVNHNRGKDENIGFLHD